METWPQMGPQGMTQIASLFQFVGVSLFEVIKPHLSLELQGALHPVVYGEIQSSEGAAASC